MSADAIRPAATLILWRDPDAPRLLMGQRRRGAVFMPEKLVFPGGAVDAGDAHAPLVGTLSPLCRARLADASDVAPETLAATAIRETWEEAGLRVGRRADWTGPPSWAGFGAGGIAPDASGLRFVFRAVTPPGRPRRFDARFFLADARTLADGPDAVGAGDGELADVRWVPLAEVETLDLPFITRVVVAEIAPLIGRDAPPARVPFFRSDDGDSFFRWLDPQEAGAPAPQ